MRVSFCVYLYVAKTLTRCDYPKRLQSSQAGGVGGGWYDEGKYSYGGDKERRGLMSWAGQLLSGAVGILKRIPKASVLFILKFVAAGLVVWASAFFGRKAWREHQERQLKAPKFAVYLQNGCRGEAISFTRSQGEDMSRARLAGLGYAMCKFEFAESKMNANDMVRSVRVEAGVNLQLYEHCSGPARTMVQGQDGSRRWSGPHQPLSKGIEGHKCVHHFCACTSLGALVAHDSSAY